MNGPSQPRRRATELLRALAVIAALPLAAAAQAVVEGYAVLGLAAVRHAATLLFAGAAVLAIVGTSGGRRHWPGTRPLTLVTPSWRWLLACLPGALCLAMAAVEHRLPFPDLKVDRTVFLWWWGGVVLLLAAGVAHAAATRRERPPAPADEWPRSRIWAAYGLLLVVAIAMRTAGGIADHPAFVESDEAWTIGQAGAMLGANPYNWFGLWWVGIPNVSLIPYRLSEMLLGETLFGGRMGSAAVGTIAVLATFAAARRLIGNLPGLVAALLVAASHTLVQWSRDAQLFIETPAAAAVLLWLLVRVWNGGSLLAWVGAALALGIGTQTYQASQFFPLLVALTILGWGVLTRASWRAVLLALVAIELLALLVMGPLIRSMLAQPDLVASRPNTVMFFSPQNRGQLGDSPGVWLAEHAARTAWMFNTGSDFFPAYGAQRGLADPVTAALVPVAAVLMLVWIRSPTAYLCLLWSLAYVVGTVFVAVHPPTYHRVATALVFASLAVGLALGEMFATIRDRLRLPGWTASVAGLAVAGAAVWANADFYFRQFPAQHGIMHTFALARILCPYRHSHDILDATFLDGAEYIPLINPPIEVECPEIAHRTRIEHVADLWEIDRFTHAEQAVLVVPTKIIQAHPGQPRGYRIVSERVDTRIHFPEPQPLTILELQRE